MRTFRPIRAGLAVIALAASILGVPASGHASGPPNPIVEGPIGVAGVRGRPWNTSLYDITPFGYAEEEYFFSGVAHTKAAESAVAAPYKSRMIVKRPAHPWQFNGTVIVEGLNVTGQADL